MADDLPYADDLFPAQKGNVPYADDLFPASVDREQARRNLGASPIQDYIFSRDHVSAARVLDHFGQGFKDAWGAEPLGLSEETKKHLQGSGSFKDYMEGHTSLAKAASDVLFRPAAVALVQPFASSLDIVARTASGAFAGAQRAVAETGADLGQPQLGRDIAAIPEAFMGTPHPMGGMRGAGNAAGISASEQLLLRARAAKVIGAGEEGWRGTAPEVPKGTVSAAEPVAVQRTLDVPPDGQSPIEKTLAGAPEAPQAAEPSAPPPDIHATARGIAPDLFYKYDELQAKRDTLSAQASELSEMRASDAAQAQEIADLKAKVQERLAATETDARELSPAVKEAYAEAQKTAPDESAVSVLPDESTAAEPAPVKAVEPVKPIEAQRASIAKDIEEKLVAAGRSETEAKAAAAIDTAYWETRAARFNGAKGTAEEMYRREAPEILGPGMQSDYATPRAKPTIARVSLGQFVSHIGIRDNDPLIADVKSITGGGRKFIRKDGVPLDKLREMAAEQGYIAKDSTIRTLLDAMRSEDKGGKVFKAGEEAAPEFDRDSHLNAIDRAIDDGLRDVGVDPKGISPEVRARTAEIMDKEHVTDAVAAYERAESEAGMFQRDPAQIETPEFKNWFGDSRVLNADGKPLVVYHGTTASFDTFDPTRLGESTRHPTSKLGFFFSADPAGASLFTQAIDASVWPPKIIDRSGANLMPVYLTIRNPFELSVEKFREINARPYGKEFELEQPEAAAITQDWIAKNKASLVAKGYDGIHIGGDPKYAERMGGEEYAADAWVAFDQKQIKSAIGNRGTFEASDPNILHQGIDIKRGRIRLREDGRNTITLLKDANASTFIHEKGHDYLARLMRDATDEKAPVDLKADADTVLKWLGVDKPSDIKTSHHEKFARGFENYVMEGRAPSHALARVFEQFRQWLVRIYTEASRLKAPINDDIRAVFDRMLSVKPEKVVLAPDLAPSELAARHEATAEVVSPHGGIDSAGAARGERDNLAAGLSPEKQDARLAEISAGLERHAPGGAEFDRHGDGTGPAAEGTGTDQGAGTVGEGGGQNAPQASQVGTPAKSASPTVKTETPASPHEPFNLTGDIADKAGNIRLDLLNAPTDVKAIISQVADEGAQFQSVRGPVTDIQVAELADAMGIDVAYLSTRKLGEAWTAPQIVALRNLLIQSATNVRDLMAKAAQGGEADLLAYAEAKTRHMMIQERVSSVTAEAGRALRAFQRRFTEGLGEAQDLGAFLKDATGKTLFQLQREVQLGMSLETPSQVSKFINDSKKATFSEMIQEFWINALLSGPTTHVKNIIGNTAVAVLSPIETAAAAGVGKVRSILGNSAERVRLGEARAEVFGMVQGAQDGLQAAKYAFLHEDQYTRAQTVEQPKFQAIPSKRIVLKTYEPGSPEYQARIESFSNARARAERLTGEKLAARIEELKANPTPDMVVEAGEKAVEIGGKQVRTPGRLLTAEDELFKNVAYRQSINKLAFRQAASEGLTGDAMNARIARLTIDPSEEMMTAATKAADYQTFTNSLGKTGAALQQFANSHLLAKIIIPFVRTPLNLLKYASERTPIGLFSREVRANLSGVNGKIAQDTQIARMAVGSSIAVATMYQAVQGNITGVGPSDKNERATLMLSGWRPYSIKIGDTYYSYSWLDPFSTIMGISADLADAYKTAGEVEETELGKVASYLLASISKNIINKASLRGASDIMNVATDPDRWGPKYIQNLIGSFVPSVIAQQAKVNDEYQREARTILDAVKARIPGLRQDLLPRRDIWGEPMKAADNLGPDTISPIALSKLTNDKATQALLDAEHFPAQLSRKIRGVDLTDQQYDEFAKTAGRMAKMRVDAIVNNPGFSNAPVNVRHDLLKKTIDSSREAARSLTMMHNPSIIKQALDNKLEAVGR